MWIVMSANANCSSIEEWLLYVDGDIEEGCNTNSVVNDSIGFTGLLLLNKLIKFLQQEGQAMDEECWSDKEFCKATENYYCLAKTIAKIQALDYDEGGELDIATVCPLIVIRPMLQPTINASSLLLLGLFKGFCFS